MREAAARQARFRSGNLSGINEDDVCEYKEVGKHKGRIGIDVGPIVKRDFFGRTIVQVPVPLGEGDGNRTDRKSRDGKSEKVLSWVSFNEGLNNAVTKPVSLRELLTGL